MKSNDKLKDPNIKNRTCYYFNDIIKTEDFDFDNVLLDQKSHKNILAYGILCKTLIGAKPLRIRFNKVDGHIRVYDGAKYLVFAISISQEFFASIEKSSILGGKT